MLGFAKPKTTVTGLKKYKQAKVFFPLFQYGNGFIQTFLHRWQSTNIVWREVWLSETKYNIN